MFERILVPLDGSELAEVALPYAEELAGRLGSRITLLYVSEPPDDQYHMHLSYMQRMAENVGKGAKRKIRNTAEKGIRVDSEILTGYPAEQIVKYADEEKMNLIVISTHGRTGIGRWAIGSVAYKVVKAASQPVLLIRARGTRSDMREKDILDRVLVPLDGSRKSEAVIPYVEELASKLKMEVTFLHAMPPDYGFTSEEQFRRLRTLRASSKDYVEKMAVRFKGKGIATKAVFKEAWLESTAVAGEIIKLANEIEADIVAMSVQGHSALMALTPGEEGVQILGSVAEKMVHSGNIPLLLVRPATAVKQTHKLKRRTT
jgi:nucleotide-binding universal stress UspA family protein